MYLWIFHAADLQLVSDFILYGRGTIYTEMSCFVQTNLANRCIQYRGLFVVSLKNTSSLENIIWKILSKTFQRFSLFLLDVEQNKLNQDLLVTGPVGFLWCFRETCLHFLVESLWSFQPSKLLVFKISNGFLRKVLKKLVKKFGKNFKKTFYFCISVLRIAWWDLKFEATD